MFNTLRWAVPEQQEKLASIPGVFLVPVLYQGSLSDEAIDTALTGLEQKGSQASPGFQNPEGVVIYMPSSRTLWKKTIGFNESKWKEKDLTQRIAYAQAV